LTEKPAGLIRPTAVAMAVDTVGVLPIFLTGALAVQLREDIGLTVGLLGSAFASYFAAAALLSAPLSRVSDRTGPGLALRIGLVVYMAAFLGIAGLAGSPLVLCSFIALGGFGTALTRTASSVLVAQNVAPRRHGLAFGLKHSSIPIGSLLAGLSVPVVGLTIGWRWAYVIAAGLALVVLFAIPGPSRRMDRQSDAGHPDMSLRLLIVAALAFSLGSFGASALGAYTVTSAVTAGMSVGSAGLLVAIGSLVGLSSRILVGLWSDRRSGSQLDLVSWMLAAGTISFLMLATVNQWVMLVAVPFSFATGWAWLGSYNLAMVKLNPDAPGAAVGVAQTGGFIGAILGPIGLGLLADRFSFRIVWIAAALSSLTAATIISGLRRVIAGPSIEKELRDASTAG
jgi:MFS family permease